jgi:hypothetical protein
MNKEIEILRPDDDLAKALAAFRVAEYGVIRIRNKDNGARLDCRFTGRWALLDFWASPDGPVLCPWFTHRKLGVSEFHSFVGCIGCDTTLESDTASAFSREEAHSVLEDYFRDGSLPDRVRTSPAPSTQDFPQVKDFSTRSENAINWRPFAELRRDR